MAIVIDDFEDGDIIVANSDYTGWSGDTGNFSASSSSPIAGSFSGLLSSTTPNTNTVAVTRTPTTTIGIGIDVRIEADLVDGRTFIRVQNSGTLLGSVEFDQDGNDILFEGNTINTLQSFSAGTVYSIAIEFDFANDEATITVDSTDYGPYALATSASDWDELDVRNAAISADQDVTVDGIIERQVEAPILGIDDTRDTEVDLSLTLGPDADETDIYRSEAPNVSTSDTLVTTASSGTSTVTDTGLENGEEYYYSGISRDTDGNLADSEFGNEPALTTTVPSPTIDTLAAASPTSIDVSWTKEDNSPDGFWNVYVDGSLETTESLGTTSYTITGLSEATSYDVSVERETDHATASTTEAQYTEPDAPTDINTELASEAGGTIRITWTDNSAGEDNYEIEESSDGKSTWTDVTTEPADTELYETGERDRLQAWFFRVRATVGSGSAAAQSAWLTSAATEFPAYANYWAVVQPVSDSDAVVRRALESGPTYEHTAINHFSHGVPGLDVESWVFADIEVFLETERLFRGEILKRRDNNPLGQTTLTAFGPGLALRRNAPSSVPVTYDAIPLADAIDDYWSNQTDGVDVSATTYTPPRTTITDDTLVISDSFSSFGALYSPPADVPVDASGGSFEPTRTAYPVVDFDDVTETSDTSGNPPYHIDSSYAVVDASSGPINSTITVDHDIPKERVGVAIHGELASGSSGGAELVFNGTQVSGAPNFDSNRWAKLENYDDAGVFGQGADLSAGNSYLIEFDVDDGADLVYNIDCYVVYDTQYAPVDFGDPTSFNEKVSGPAPYAPIQFVIDETELRPYPITEARIDSAVSSTVNQQQYSASVNGFASSLTAAQTAATTFDFAANDQWGEELSVRLTLDGDDSTNAWLSTRASPISVTSLDVYATTQDVALASDLRLTGTHEDNLRRLHREASMRYVVDPTLGPRDPLTVESFDPEDPAVVRQPTWTTVDDTESERDAVGYANAVTIVYNDGNGDPQQFVKTANQSEVSRVGEEKRAVVPRTDVSTVDEARRAAVQEERKRIAEDSESGTIRAVATTGVFAGYPYDVPAFGGATPLDDRVEYTESGGSDNPPEMTLQFIRQADPLERQLRTEQDVSDLKRSD